MADKEWNITQAKDGDFVADDRLEFPFIGIFKSMNDDGTFNVYCYLHRGKDQEFAPPLVNMLNGKCNCDGKNPDGMVLATEEQKKLLFYKMHEAGYWWDAENKEVKKSKDREKWHPKHMVFSKWDPTIPCRTCSLGWAMGWTCVPSTHQWMCRCRHDIFNDSIPSYNRDCERVQKWIAENTTAYQLVDVEDWYSEPWYYFNDPHYIIKEE